jgi:prolipoprotein diacylglyceryltransferase
MLVLAYPRIPPVIISVGPLAIRWYGVMGLRLRVVRAAT